MLDTTIAGTTELSLEETQAIAGGGFMQIAVYLTACFKAGFSFGYYEVGPALF